MKQTKNTKINWIAIICTLAGLTVFSFILFLALAQAAKETKPSGKGKPMKAGSVEEEVLSGKTLDYDREILAVLKELDVQNRRITLLDTESKETLELFYTGATDICDKFGQVITAGQIPVGTMVEAYYAEENHKLAKLQISTKAWEYHGVNHLEINRTDKIMKIGKTKYKYPDELVVLDNGKLVSVNNLAEQDVLNVWGYDQTIWSVTVVKGHGTVILLDQEAFLGGSVTVGYEAMQIITEDLLLTVREGNYNLTVENGKYSGTKNITIERNKVTEVSLKDLGPAPVRKGKVTFEIKPFGADLFIDGQLTSYANPVELDYGNHEIKVSLGGYITYEGTLKLGVAGKKIKINLPEENSRVPAEVTETVDETEVESGAVTDETDEDSGTEYNEWNYPGEDDGFEEDPDTEDTDEDYIIDDGHQIYVQYPVGASVYLNGDYMGVSPGSFAKVIGSHVLTFIKEGYETKSYTIDVLDDGMDMYLSLPDLVKTGR
jgi:hypothetical protein